jgi:hypothetical protein
MRSHLLSLPLLLIACAPRPTGVQGGVLVPYSQFTRKADKVYTAGACHDRTGAPVSNPDEVEYELHRGGGQTEFVEHALSEEQARLMNNRWEDRDGVHYFVWLKDVRGFEYLLPADAGRPAQRRVYRSPQVRQVKANGQTSVQPLGQPDIVCELLAMR